MIAIASKFYVTKNYCYNDLVPKSITQAHSKSIFSVKLIIYLNYSFTNELVLVNRAMFKLRKLMIYRRL